MEMDLEQRLQLAIALLQSDATISMRAAAKTFSVQPSTLSRRIKGQKPKQEAYSKWQRLSIAEEASLEATILHLQHWGWPMTINFLQNFTTRLIQARGDTEPLGVNWYKGFLKRHQNLKTAFSRSLEGCYRRDSTERMVHPL